MHTLDRTKTTTLNDNFHCLVHEKTFFNKITISYSMCEHSYMEGDWDMTAVSCKSDVELPSNWVKWFWNARKHPKPFNTIYLNNSKFFINTEYLKQMYQTTCPMKTRPIRQVKAANAESKLMAFYRESWNGSYIESAIKKLCKLSPWTQSTIITISWLPVSKAKY